MAVRPIDANALARRIREYMDDFPKATTRLATCRVILSMLGDDNQTPTLTQPNEPLTVTEVCPHCESEITMEWDVKTRGHKAVCPVCGNRLMLCDECQHGEPGHRCDYDSDTDTCRFNRRPPEGEEETP